LGCNINAQEILTLENAVKLLGKQLRNKITANNLSLKKQMLLLEMLGCYLQLQPLWIITVFKIVP
jgi:hypothetical protein